MSLQQPSFLLENQNLKQLNTWLVGGSARFFAQPRTTEEVGEVLFGAHRKGIPVFVLGSGSNVLVLDEVFPGLVLSTRSLLSWFHEPQESCHFFVAGSGVPKSELLKHLLRLKNPAALFLAGIPGTLGGGVAMNAGVSEELIPREFVGITHSVELCSFQGDSFWRKASEFNWDYRHCGGIQGHVVTRVRLRVGIHSDELVPMRVRELNQRRLQRQPLSQPSCGSVFRNPAQGPKAAQLIEQCGLKGLQIGGAQVSTKHANFIVNLGGARAADMQACMERVQEEVWACTGVELKSEVVFLRSVLN
ncbi:MAG: UDP-N-acetylmuramate dehydrogenase [Bdellovibrio sp.]